MFQVQERVVPVRVLGYWCKAKLSRAGSKLFFKWSKWLKIIQTLEAV